jgi:hypothetical protein
VHDILKADGQEGINKAGQDPEAKMPQGAWYLENCQLKAVRGYHGGLWV